MKIRLDANEVDRAIRDYVAGYVTDAKVETIEITRGKGKTVYADVTFDVEALSLGFRGVGKTDD